LLTRFSSFLLFFLLFSSFYFSSFYFSSSYFLLIIFFLFFLLPSFVADASTTSTMNQGEKSSTMVTLFEAI